MKESKLNQRTFQSYKTLSEYYETKFYDTINLLFILENSPTTMRSLSDNYEKIFYISEKNPSHDKMFPQNDKKSIL